jgi:SAM-dependent methyltransferase
LCASNQAAQAKKYEVSHLQSATQARPTELRYRIADFINDRLKVLPGFHAAAKAAAASLIHGRATARAGEIPRGEGSAAAERSSNRRSQSAVAEPPVPDAPSEAGPSSLDNLPLPPLEMRELVGPTDPAAFDNPSGGLVYNYLDPALYGKFFDFGCGCGRVARQLILQQPQPGMYVGVDLHAGMIRWCQRSLQPAAPNFTFLHHDVFNVRFNPNPTSPSVRPFPVADSEFTLINALSVFTHLTQEQAVHYLRECARILHPQGVLHASWFLFEKREFPMMRPESNTLYVSYEDPSAAVFFDRDWVRATARQFGLRLCGIVAPQIRGHQWILMMTKRENVEEPEFPPDAAAYGSAAPALGSRRDVSKIGLE